MNRNIKYLRFIIIGAILFTSNFINSQQLYKKLIYSLPDSIDFNKELFDLRIDSSSNYFFSRQNHHSGNYIYTNKSIFGPIDKIKNDGKTRYFNLKEGKLKNSMYFYSDEGAKLFGPIEGEYAVSSVSDNGNICAAFLRNDSIIYCLNSVEILRFSRYEISFPHGSLWCTTNNKCDYLLNVEKGDYCLIYHNGVLIDSSRIIMRMDIDESGNYVYTKNELGTEIESPSEIVYNGKVIYDGPYTGWISMKKGKPFYFEFDHISQPFILFKDTIFHYENCAVRNEYGSQDGDDDFTKRIVFPEYQSFFNLCREGTPKIELSFNAKELGKFDYVYCPSMDSVGNYSCFVINDYYLYTFINGTLSEPISKFGLRPEPVLLSPNGDYFVCYRTKDSHYLYKNNKDLILQTPKSQRIKFSSLSYQFEEYDLPRNLENQYIYVETGEKCYFLAGSNYYGPLNKLIHWSGAKENSMESSGIFENNSLYVIINTGDGNYRVIYNGVDYGLINNIKHVIRHSFFQNEKGFKFYTFMFNEIYQYSSYEE